MRYEHDCNRCRPLGEFNEFDLYYCKSIVPTVVARYSSHGPDYTSGIDATDTHPELAEAKRRAIAENLIWE